MKRFDPDSITNEELLDALKALALSLGRTPSRKDMMSGTGLTKRLYLYGRRFGGLTEACELAGLKANLGGTDLKYTKEELLDHITELSGKLGHTPTQEDITDADKYAIGAYKRHFGTYNAALKELGMRHNSRSDFTEQDIISDILRIAAVLNRSPMVTEFDKYSNTVSHVTAYSKLSCKNSWNAVLKKCGLKVMNNRNITDQELKDEVERLRLKLSRLPGYYDMVQLGVYSPETYSERFGSYIQALKHFGYDYTSESQWYNQTHTAGKDGRCYKSKFEANIADCLFDLKSAGKILSYEYEKPVCADRKWTCDFYIELDGKSYWLEADGMGKNRFDPYDGDNEKIEYYAANGYRHLIIPYKKIDLARYLSNLIL